MPENSLLPVLKRVQVGVPTRLVIVDYVKGEQAEEKPVNQENVAENLNLKEPSRTISSMQETPPSQCHMVKWFLSWKMFWINLIQHSDHIALYSFAATWLKELLTV